jgi:hypothetical protein
MGGGGEHNEKCVDVVLSDMFDGMFKKSISNPY